MSNELVKFENKYIQTKENFSAEDGNIFASVTIDGFPADENEEGQVVAEVFCTQHGDIVVAWHHNGYRGHEEVLSLIKESKKALEEMYKKEILDALEETDLSDKIKWGNGIFDAINTIIEAINVGVLHSNENGYVSVIVNTEGGDEWQSMPIIEAAFDLTYSGETKSLKEAIEKKKNA